MRPIPEPAVDLVMRFEGAHDGDPDTPEMEPEKDPIGLWTVGYGHYVRSPEELEYYRQNPLSHAQAIVLLAKDMGVAARAVLRLVRVPLTDGQYGALVSWTYNLGAGNLQASTMRQKINREDHEAVPAEMKKWRRAGGVILPGLVRRRAAEAEMYQW